MAVRVQPAASLAQAVDWLRNDRLDEADQALAVLCARRPPDPDALHFRGVLRHRQGRSAEGIALVRQSLALRPGNAGALNNLGNLLVESGSAEEAMPCYRRSAECAGAPQQAAHAWANLAGLLRRAGQAAQAREACDRAIAADAAHGAAWYVRAELLAESGQVAESVHAYSRAVTLLPQQQTSRAQVLRALQLLGEREQAARLLHEWLDEAPGDPVAQHLLDASEGRTPPRASDAYVAQVFDSYADSFDASLERLLYRAPALVAGAVEAAFGPPAGTLDVVDAGCGTGLVAPLLRPWAKRLAGCDLSVGMLRQARRRGGYDVLHQAELGHYLATQPSAFDLVVSADTLCYFGGLHAVLADAARALRPGGWVVFTVEAMDEGDAPFRLALSGRYAHAGAHLQQALAAAGFGDIVIEPAVPRHEAGAEVAGWLARARLPLP